MAYMVDDPWFPEVQNLLLPERCVLCRASCEHTLCTPCRDSLPWNRLACPRCARPQSTAPAHLCADCAAEAPEFDAAWSAFRYAEPVAQAIHRLKYHADFRSARWLAEEMVSALAARPEPLPDLLLPVPLHGRRLQKRGYNQALELARRLAGRLVIEVDIKAARRLRATEDQIGKTAPERRRNVKGAFAVEPARVRDKHVALLDDVMTTGSTLAELARACRKAGAARIEVWTAARAV